MRISTMLEDAWNSWRTTEKNHLQVCVEENKNLEANLEYLKKYDYDGYLKAKQDVERGKNAAKNGAFTQSVTTFVVRFLILCVKIIEGAIIGAVMIYIKTIMFFWSKKNALSKVCAVVFAVGFIFALYFCFTKFIIPACSPKKLTFESGKTLEEVKSDTDSKTKALVDRATSRIKAAQDAARGDMQAINALKIAADNGDANACFDLAMLCFANKYQLGLTTVTEKATSNTFVYDVDPNGPAAASGVTQGCSIRCIPEQSEIQTGKPVQVEINEYITKNITPTRRLKSFDGTPEDGIRWLEKAAEKGSVEAKTAQARILMTGQYGQPKDFVKGLALIEEAAKKNDSYALMDLYQCYDASGKGCVPDQQKAKAFLTKAFLVGNPIAETYCAEWNYKLVAVSIPDWSSGSVKQLDRKIIISFMFSDFGDVIFYGPGSSQTFDTFSTTIQRFSGMYNLKKVHQFLSLLVNSENDVTSIIQQTFAIHREYYMSWGVGIDDDPLDRYNTCCDVKFFMSCIKTTLANMYLQGIGCEKNQEKAIALWRQAAMAGHLGAKEALKEYVGDTPDSTGGDVHQWKGRLEDWQGLSRHDTPRVFKHL